MKKLLAVIAILMTLQSTAQTTPDISTNDRGELVYNGAMSFADLLKEPKFTWMPDGIKNYTPDATSINYLKENLGAYNIVVLLGTWCEDSHNLIPKLYVALDEAQYPIDKVRMYGVDREKKSKTGEEKTYKVTNVPTIILLKGDKEIGRITEMVKRSVDTDMFVLIEADKAKK